MFRFLCVHMLLYFVGLMSKNVTARCVCERETETERQRNCPICFPEKLYHFTFFPVMHLESNSSTLFVRMSRKSNILFACVLYICSACACVYTVVVCKEARRVFLYLLVFHTVSNTGVLGFRHGFEEFKLKSSGLHSKCSYTLSHLPKP